MAAQARYEGRVCVVTGAASGIELVGAVPAEISQAE